MGAALRFRPEPSNLVRRDRPAEPFRSRPPTGSVMTDSSTAAKTLGPTSVCPAAAWVLSREDRFVTDPSAA